MKPAIILHHHEITLKGDNRPLFERQLMRNTRRAVAGILPSSAIHGGYGRFVVDVPDEKDVENLAERFRRVFGLANVCVGLKTEQDVGKFCEAADVVLKGRTFSTIKVDTRRADKRFPVGSMEVNVKVGEYLCSKYGVRGNMTTPDETLYIEIVDGVAYVYLAKLRGAGGLPAGISGKVTELISAGFDSPVAGYRMMKRGARVVFVHFHSQPYVSQDSVDQVRQLVDLLTGYQYDSKLYIVPIGEVQQEVVAKTQPSLRVILYRRLMVRIAETIALGENSQALVTGESLGQVASQTLRNIRIIDSVAELPILRPLVGMDKEEIIQTAREIGTYDISRQPYDDCCSYLTPRNPATWADPKIVEENEMKLDVPKLVTMSLEKTSIERFSYGLAVGAADV